jgi:methylmalonyl-CoA mutase
MGTLKEYKGRADFSRNFFEVAGFDVKYPTGFSNFDDAILKAEESQSKIIVICSTDEKYAEIVPAFAAKIKAKLNNITLVLAGYPKDKIEEYKNCGVDEFIYLGADAYSILSNIFENNFSEVK